MRGYRPEVRYAELPAVFKLPPGLCLFLCLFLCLCLCMDAKADTSVSASDAEGRIVTLSKPAQRIVALAPHIVENLFSVGAGERIVAAVQYSDYPAAAAALPRVGGVAGISLESIVALQPDLVVVWGSGSPLSLRQGLRDLGIDYFVDEIRSIAELKLSLRALAKLTGNSPKAEKLLENLSEQLEQMTSRAAQALWEPPGVFLQVWDQPLQSIGGAHLLNEVIERCGGRSITAGISGLAPRISLESVLAADPGLIIVESAAQGRHWQAYPRLTAVKYQRIVSVDPDLLHRPTLRLLAGMQKVCAAIAALPAAPAKPS